MTEENWDTTYINMPRYGVLEAVMAIMQEKSKKTAIRIVPVGIKHGPCPERLWNVEEMEVGT